MESHIKRILRQTGLKLLTIVGFLAGTLSTKLSFVRPTIQFLGVTIIISVLLVVLFNLFYPKKRYELYSSIVFSSLLFFIVPVDSLLATAFLLGIVCAIVVPLYWLNRFYGAAIIAHFADVVSTLLVIPEGSESNLVARKFMSYLGSEGGLIVLKILLVGMPLLYSYNNLDKESQQIFTKIVFLVGISMASRNLLLLFI